MHPSTEDRSRCSSSAGTHNAIAGVPERLIPAGVRLLAACVIAGVHLNDEALPRCGKVHDEFADDGPVLVRPP
jgi:hypothetical protein